MFLPVAERRGEICFHVLKRLPYFPRLVLSFSLMAAGFAMQTFQGQQLLLPGIFVVFLGVLPLLTKGYQNVVHATEAAKDWRPVTRAEIERILDVARRQKRWDRDMFDITSWQGVLTLIAICGGAYVAVFHLIQYSEPLAVMVGGNAAVIVLPFWFTGARRILKNDKLVVKCDLLLKLADFLAQEPCAGEEFQFQLQTARAEGQEADIPRDVKGLVAYANAPEGFLGVQVQISINSVQGTDYPYCYCVIVAKPEFTDKRPLDLSPPPRKVVLEPEFNAGVNIVVIRQETTRNSGYHTKPAAAIAILNYAVQEARRLIA